MQSVQRRFGKLLPRTADESQVAVLLKDFDDADKMFTKARLNRIIDASKAWRDAWVDILLTQQRLVHSFQVMYSPFIGSNENYEGHQPVETPQHIMGRTIKLQEGYAELKTDLLDEVNMVDTRIIKPAMDAKDYIHPLKKLDYEKYQGRVDTARKKTKRTEKDNISLAKAEDQLVYAKEEYALADGKLKSCLPPVVTAAFSLLPHLLAAQIMTQNALLGHYYTMLHTYCEEEGFPSPPPPMSDIIATWNADFVIAQQELESIPCVAGGKAVRQPLKMEDQKPHGTMTGLNIRNGYAQRRSSNQVKTLKAPVSPSISATAAPAVSPGVSEYDGPPTPPDSSTRPKISSVPSQTSLALATPNYNPHALRSPSPGDVQTIHAPAGPRSDYFSRDRLPSNSSLATTSSMASIAAGKKKPPPPPPKKRPSEQGVWVAALYDFPGQGGGDLSFREGDRIKVVKKTDSLDDWWEGELRGVRGSFPANYCKAA